MKKALFIFVLGLLFLPEIGHAQMYPSDALTVVGEIYDSAELNLDCTDHCTILSSHLTLVTNTDSDTDYHIALSCELGVDLQKFQQIGYYKSTNSPIMNSGSSYTGQLVCDDIQAENMLAVTYTYPVYYEITYLPYDIHGENAVITGQASTSPLFVASTNTPSTNDWLFVSMVGIFLMSFVTWGYFFSPSKSRHAYSH